ncbi:hypothetical protein D3C75_609700 [compost metagenome]
MGQCRTVLRNHAQIGFFTFWQRIRFFQFQVLFATKFKGIGDEILAGFTIGEGQLPLVTRRVQAEVKGFARLILAVHQHFLCTFLRQLVGAAVVGEGDGDGTDQREQDEQPHAGKTGVNITPGISLAVSVNI